MNVILILVGSLLMWVCGSSHCDDGKESLRPINYVQLQIDLGKAVQEIRSFSQEPILYTTVNKEAAKHNLLPFSRSISLISKSLVQRLVVVCFDSLACHLCKSLASSSRCVYSNNELHQGSLAPSTEEDNDYWKLTFGRWYISKLLAEAGVAFLAVDVDSVLLTDPFGTDGSISKHPNAISVVEDARPLNLSNSDDAFLNGGFVFFPQAAHSVEVVEAMWRENCKRQNDQVLLTKLLRERKQRDSTFPAVVLDAVSHKNFCNTKCGSGRFSAVDNIADLRKIEQEMSGWMTSAGKECSSEARSRWEFFHVACVVWPDGGLSRLARAKSRAQWAILRWLRREGEGAMS